MKRNRETGHKVAGTGQPKWALKLKNNTRRIEEEEV
jgi:hypothetical protein